MKSRTCIVFFIVLFFLFTIGCRKEKTALEIEQDIYITVTKEFLKSMNVPIDKGDIVFDENNSKFNQFLGTDDPSFSVLRNKKFQSVVYLPKSNPFTREITFGGDIWVFIDKETKTVLHVFRGK